MTEWNTTVVDEPRIENEQFRLTLTFDQSQATVIVLSDAEQPVLTALRALYEVGKPEFIGKVADAYLDSYEEELQ